MNFGEFLIFFVFLANFFPKKKNKELQHDIHIPKYFSQNSENSPPKKLFHQPVSNQGMIIEYMFCNLSIWVGIKVNDQYLPYSQSKVKVSK